MFEISKYIRRDGIVERCLQFIISIFIITIRFIFQRRFENSKIVIITIHKLGDTVFTIPAIKVLKKEFGSGITIVCYDDSKKIYELAFDDLEYLTLKKNDFHFHGRIANFRSRRKLNNINAGTIIDLTGAVNSASLIFNNRAKKIIGFSEKYFEKIYSDFFLKRKIPHLMNLYLDVAKVLVKIENENEIKSFGKSTTHGEYILLHPFAGWNAKEWGIEKFIKLAELLNKNNKCKLIIPNDRADNETLSLINSKNISYKISSKVSELIEAIENASAVIGCDSGAVYIASLLGKPTFTIYGPTNPRFSLPFGEHHDYIQKEIKCSPGLNEQYCYLDAGKKCPLNDCMKSLTVQEVHSRINSFFEKIISQNISEIAKGTNF